MIKNLNVNEQKLRDLYLRKLALGIYQGPPTGYASLDKPWLKFYKEAAIETKIPSDISMYNLMKKQNQNNLNSIALEYYGTTITYEEFFRQIDKVASKYLALGIKKKDIVSICMPTTPEVVYTIYALNKIGAICDMIDPRCSREQLDYYLKENHSQIIMLCENYYKDLYPSLTKNYLRTIILTKISHTGNLKFKTLVNLNTTFHNLGTEKLNNVLTYDEFMNIPSVVEKNISKVNGDDIAIVVHSSGTTSTPKGILLTNKNVNSIAVQYSLTPLTIEKGHRFLSVIPAFASFGVVTSINLPLYLSMENHLVSVVTPKVFAKKLEKDKIHFTLTVPANFKYIAKQKKKRDYSNLYGPGAGGYSVSSKEDREINDGLKRNHCHFNMLMGWGMSELSSTACLEFNDCSHELSSGVPLVKNTISIFEPGTDKELTYFNEGEICVTGPSIMKGYLNNPEKTAKIIKKHPDGKVWLHSGDIGYMDYEGRVYHVDRLERMIIKGRDGFKIFPQQLEEKICLSKYVDSAVVVGHLDTLKGLIPKAYIVPKDLTTPEEIIIKDVETICNNNLSKRACPEAYQIIEKLPYTKMGKIDYKFLENENNVKKLIRKK